MECPQSRVLTGSATHRVYSECLNAASPRMSLSRMRLSDSKFRRERGSLLSGVHGLECAEDSRPSARS